MGEVAGNLISIQCITIILSNKSGVARVLAGVLKVWTSGVLTTNPRGPKLSLYDVARFPDLLAADICC